MGSPTDISRTKEITVNFPRFPLSFALCYFQYFSLCPKHLDIAKTHFVQLSVHFCQERGTVTVDLGRSYKVTLTLGYSRNTEKQLYRSKRRQVKYYLSVFSVHVVVELTLSHSSLQTGLLPTAPQHNSLPVKHCCYFYNSSSFNSAVGFTTVYNRDKLYYCFAIHSYLSLFFSPWSL